MGRGHFIPACLSSRPICCCNCRFWNEEGDRFSVRKGWARAPEEADVNLKYFITNTFQGVVTKVTLQACRSTTSSSHVWLPAFWNLYLAYSWQGMTLPWHRASNPQHGTCQGRTHCWWNHRGFYSFALIYKQKCHRGQSPVSCHTATNWSWTPTVRPWGDQLAWWPPSDTILPTHTVCWNQYTEITQWFIKLPNVNHSLIR